MKFKHKRHGVVLEPRHELAESMLQNNPDYEEIVDPEPTTTETKRKKARAGDKVC